MVKMMRMSNELLRVSSKAFPTAADVLSFRSGLWPAVVARRFQFTTGGHGLLREGTESRCGTLPLRNEDEGVFIPSNGDDIDPVVSAADAGAPDASQFVISDAAADLQQLEALVAEEEYEEKMITALPISQCHQRENMAADHVAESETKATDDKNSYISSSVAVRKGAVTSTDKAKDPNVTTHGYFNKQDALYLAPITPQEARVPSVNPPQPSSCVMVVFAANDMRVHDNYALALAARRAQAAGGLPVIAVAVVDYRSFAQPTEIGGFFKQSPMRARFFLETLAKLREKLEGELRVPLLIRCGRPEEHIPRLVVECSAIDVFLTTQYTPHEKEVHDAIMNAVKNRRWVCRDPTSNFGMIEHDATITHPYYGSSGAPGQAFDKGFSLTTAAVPHSVWQTTLVHIEDLPVPVASMAEGERWYHDDVTTANIRPTAAFDRCIDQLRKLPVRHDLLPSTDELRGLVTPPAYRGCIPTVAELGYGSPEAFVEEEVIATQSSHPPGEDAAIERLHDWLMDGGMSSMLRYGRERRTNTKMYSQRLSRLSPYLSCGALSPRRFYEELRRFTAENVRDNFVQQQYREAILRLSRRDYWHWMGLRYGSLLFYEYGPRPEHTDDIADWRHDRKIVQKWCAGLTGIPFADAAMRELLLTGFVASEGRQGLVWLLSRGYGQDWRLGAEWLGRCSLDYDPFVCYGNCAYYSELIRDDFGESVRSIHWLAHHHDQTGIYVKKWLPQLSKIPPVYIHRPHVLTPRMQAMHGVQLGRNYPYPLKLWDGAQYTLGSEQLTTYFGKGSTWQLKAKNGAGGPGYAEALRHGTDVLETHRLQHSAFDDADEVEAEAAAAPFGRGCDCQQQDMLQAATLE
uniref:Uncharacterized protein TCIL3000_11_12970 n=1 Tax=Trypanosoma congolense (strain IL3000) TaxID=1068625 RepID=G0V2C7_TRYCI|nr:unnamed protein product [Trypanosoma congolense IL3000]